MTEQERTELRRLMALDKRERRDRKKEEERFLWADNHKNQLLARWGYKVADATRMTDNLEEDIDEDIDILDGILTEN